MKKMYIFFALFSFSLFISSVRADTYNVTIPNHLTSLTQSNFDTMLNTFNNTSITNKQYCTIFSTSSSNYTFSLVCGNSITYNTALSPNTILYGNCRKYTYNSDFTSLSQASYHFNCVGDRFEYYYAPNYASTPFVVYSNFDLLFQSSDNIYNYTYIDKVYTMPVGSNMKVNTIYDMYIDYNTDPYPLFTSFFDIVIEKLQLICEFFTSSYIYLSIFVVIMFYFIILLIRRLI